MCPFNGKIAVDYRVLNKKTILRTFQKIKGAKIFNLLDLQNGHLHITVKHNDRHKTAFVLSWDKYQWKRLPLVTLGTPFTFTEAMISIFPDLLFVAVYFDDMLLFSESIDQHLEHLKIAFDCLV